MLARLLAALWLLLTAACAGGAASTAAEPSAPGVAGVRAGGVYEVLDAAGRAFVVLGEARRTPERLGAPVVIAQGVAVEVAEQRALGEPLDVTVVDARGTCVTRAGARLLLGRYQGGSASWLDALELEGCVGNPALPRVALIGSVEQARWLEPQEAVFVDGVLARAAEFVAEGEGREVLRRYEFSGSEIVLEQSAGTLRLLRGKRVVASYPELAVAGAVTLVDRLLVVLDGGGLTVVELVGGRAVTLLSRRGTPQLN
jgi:hypothetical protein